MVLRGTKGVPRKGVGASVNMRVLTCKELRAKHHQTNCYLRPPFLGTPLVSSRMVGRGEPKYQGHVHREWHVDVEVKLSGRTLYRGSMGRSLSRAL